MKPDTMLVVYFDGFDELSALVQLGGVRFLKISLL